MTPFQGLILGLIQGLTEFLPVSSSGHLVITQNLFQLTEPPIIFDILVHLATSLAVIIVIFNYLKNINLTQIKLILIASIPAGVIGILLNQQIETLFSSLRLVSFSLIVTGLILFSTKKLAKKKSSLNSKNSFFIGLAQALAIIPGISRSGSTITAGLHQGLTPKDAFNFSFLISLPAIFGAQLLQLNKLGNLSSAELPTLAIGFFTAFISGLLALKTFKKLVIKGKLSYFGFYCLALGCIVLFFARYGTL
ncbi:MAG: undecaprenyl-diphosphate phosphatase [Candidatus Beckwithbacteria bacterium]|nr:undecaprenyl-diphosphate phosphatase [Patescibacteria group bacterium]